MRARRKWTIRRLFSGQPGSLRLFRLVRCYITSLGAVRVEAAKTMVTFACARKFAWVWLPQLWTKKRPLNSITLSFALARRLSNARIAKPVEVYPGRWMHHVVIEKQPDFDDAVRGWLRKAYTYGLCEAPRKKREK